MHLLSHSAMCCMALKPPGCLNSVKDGIYYNLYSAISDRGVLTLQELAITSNEALSLANLPDGPIVLVGAGYISLEFAGIFNGMGKDVHIVYRKALPLVG